MPLVLVSVSEAQIKHRGRAVPKLCRERRCEEIGVRKGLVVDNRHRSPTRSWHGEVVGVGKVDAFDAPKHARGAVAAHHNVVAAVVGALDARKIAGHAGRVAAGSGVAVGFFDREGPGTHRGHFVHDFAILGGRHFRGLHGDHALLQFDAQHHGAAACDDDAFHDTRLVSDERHLQGVATERHVFQLEATVKVGGGDELRCGQHLHGGPEERKACFSVDDGTRDGGGLGKKKAWEECECRPKELRGPF